MTCPTHSTCVDVFPPFCRCQSGYVLLGDVCSTERIFTMYEIHLDMVFLPGNGAILLEGEGCVKKAKKTYDFSATYEVQNETGIIELQK